MQRAQMKDGVEESNVIGNTDSAGDALAELDSTRILQQVFEMGDDFVGPAKDVLLSWLIGLDASISPAEAAAKLTRAYRPLIVDKDPNSHLMQFYNLLVEVAAGPCSFKPVRGHVSRRRRRDTF